MHESRTPKFADICRTGAAVNCLKSGQSFKDISKSAGTGDRTVRRWVKKAGFSKKGGQWRHASESRATRIVSALLEDEPIMQRVCAACEKEQGIKRTAPDPNITHGLCRRHFTELYSSAYTPERIAAMPDSKFSPDSSQTAPKASFAPNPGYAA